MFNIISSVTRNVLQSILGGQSDQNNDYPLTVPGLVAYWDPTEEPLVEKDVDNKISRIIDKSNNAIDLIQSEEIQRPIWSATAFNGHPGALYDSDAACFASESNLPLSSTNQVTIIACHKNETASLGVSGLRMIAELTDNYNNYNYGFYLGYENTGGTINGLVSGLMGNVGYNGYGHNSYFVNEYQILLAEYNKSVTNPQTTQIKNGDELTRDGTIGNANNTNNFGNALMYIGARNFSTFYFEGVISPIVIYNRILTPAEKAGIFAYFSNKFGISISHNRITRSGHRRVTRDGSTRITRL